MKRRPEKKRDRKGNEIVVGVAWYRAEDYPRLLEVATDRKGMHSRFVDWEQSALLNNDKLREQGIRIEKIEIDLEELIAWCNARNRSNDGAARAEFAVEKLRARLSPNT